MSGLTAREQRLLVWAYGANWQSADVLLSDDGIGRAIASSHSGSVRSEPWAFHTDRKGIWCGLDAFHGQGELVSWAAVRGHRASLRPSILDTLQSARIAHQTANLAAFNDGRPDGPPIPRSTRATLRDAVLAALPLRDETEPTDLLAMLEQMGAPA